MDAAPQPDHIVVAAFGCKLPDGESDASQESTRVVQKGVVEWWRDHNQLQIFSGAWHGLLWDELPEHIKDDVEELYYSARCQH